MYININKRLDFFGSLTFFSYICNEQKDIKLNTIYMSDKIYPIYTDVEKEVTIIDVDDLKQLIKEVYKDEVSIDNQCLNINSEIYTRHCVIPDEQDRDEMRYLNAVLDDLCYLEHLKEGIHFIKYE